MSEKRIHQRAPVKLTAQYCFASDPQSSQKATVINISAGGFCLTTLGRVNPGIDLIIAIELNGKKSVKINVRVIWCRPKVSSDEFMCGVKINDATGPDFEQFLSYYCNQVAKLFDEV